MLRERVKERAVALGCRGGHVLVGASGGIDSSVLSHLLAGLREALSLRVTLAHVNHGLRGEGSWGDQQAVMAMASALNTPVLVREVAPRALREEGPSRARPTLQEACRRVRYDALFEMAREVGADRIATAHTLDDQAETVLLRVLRGAGPDGLGGIPERSAEGRVVRPLLGTTRAEIEHYAHQRRLNWREDPSNADPAYARSRLRAAWIPRLGEAFNPAWLRAVGNLAEAQRRDTEWIESLVEQEAARLFLAEEPSGGIRIAAEGWRERPEALARRLARRAWRQLGGSRDVSRKHLLRVVDFLRRAHAGTAIELPGGILLRRDQESFWIGPAGEPSGEC